MAWGQECASYSAILSHIQREKRERSVPDGEGPWGYSWVLSGLFHTAQQFSKSRINSADAPLYRSVHTPISRLPSGHTPPHLTGDNTLFSKTPPADSSVWQIWHCLLVIQIELDLQLCHVCWVEFPALPLGLDLPDTVTAETTPANHHQASPQDDQHSQTISWDWDGLIHNPYAANNLVMPKSKCNPQKNSFGSLQSCSVQSVGGCCYGKISHISFA